jgi:transcriptional/translational regulatory protein YebC/TACO1
MQEGTLEKSLEHAIDAGAEDVTTDEVDKCFKV